MEEFLIGLAKEGGPTALAVMIGLYFLKKTLELAKKELEENTQSIKELVKSINKLEHSVVKLEIQVEVLNKGQGKIDRTAEGVNILFRELNVIKEKLNGPG